MEIILTIILVVIIAFAVIIIAAIKKIAKVKEAFIAFKQEIILSENVAFFCKELSVIPVYALKNLESKEQEIIDYLAYMVKNYLQLSHLLSEMAYYKLKPEAKQFVIDHLKKAWANQSAAIIYAEIICGEAIGYPNKSNSGRERNFIMYNYKDNSEFQVAVIENLQATKNSSLLKPLEVDWIDQEIKKLQKQFTKKIKTWKQLLLSVL